MAGFRSLKEYSDAVNDGKTFLTMYRKVTPNINMAANLWYDNSMYLSTPRPQFYASSPLTSAQMYASTLKGLFHHGDVNAIGKSKYIHRVTMTNDTTVAAVQAVLCDYLMYYPFIDTSTNDLQTMTNSFSLPRYTDGVGVKMMLVAQAPCANLVPSFVINYTNSDGVAGRVTPTHSLSSGTFNGALMSSSTSITGGLVATIPFVGLQRGDIGVRSVESMRFTSSTDVGLVAIVLVKPLMTIQLSDNLAYSEKYPIFSNSSFVEIKDDAYLNFIMCPSTNVQNTTTNAEIEFIIT